MSKSAPLDLEALKNSSDGLDASQNEAIKAQVFEKANRKDEQPKLDEEEDGFKAPLPEKDTEEKAGDKKIDDDAQETEEQKKAREEAEVIAAEAEAEAEAKKTEDDRIKAVEAAKAKVEAERTDEEKAILQQHTAAEEAAKKEAISKEAKEYALENGVSEKAALKEVEHFHNVRNKFKSDPREMSKAIYHLNAKLTQQAQELSAIKNAPKEGELVIGGKTLSKEQVKELFVEKYRKAHPDLTEDLDDDKVFAIADKDFQDRVRAEKSNQMRTMQDKAEKNKQAVIDSLPDADKRFAKSIGVALSRVAPHDLAADDFDAEDYIAWARGQFYHSDLAEAEKRGYDRAIKEKRILGQKPENASGAGGGAPAKKDGASGLTSEEQDRALDMYKSSQVSDAEKFKMFEDFKKSTGQKK